YDTAMGFAAKQMRSLKRFAEDANVAIGQLLLPTFTKIIPIAKGFLVTMRDIARDWKFLLIGAGVFPITEIFEETKWKVIAAEQALDEFNDKLIPWNKWKKTSLKTIVDQYKIAIDCLNLQYDKLLDNLGKPEPESWKDYLWHRATTWPAKDKAE
ncbi:hypothetical protein LCGC14_2420200, partial [marine sediment metagenome]